MTNLNRLHITGKSGAAILAAGMGMPWPTTPEEHRDPIFRVLRRLHKQEVLQLCEDYSQRKGLRLEARMLP